MENYKNIVRGVGATVGGAAGAVILTGLSFAVIPVAPLAAICFGVGVTGGAVSGGWCSGKIYDKAKGKNNNIDDIPELLQQGNEIKRLEDSNEDK